MFWLYTLATIIAVNAFLILFDIRKQYMYEQEWETKNHLFQLAIGILNHTDRQVTLRLSGSDTYACTVVGLWRPYFSFVWTKLK